MRMSDWSSGVGSSDLGREPAMMRAIACALAIATVPLLVAAAPTPRVHSIVIDKMKFGPAPAELRAGDTILWVNKDLFRPTATARDGSCHVDLPAGQNEIGREACRERVCQYG